MKESTKKMLKGSGINILVPIIVYSLFAIICASSGLTSFFSSEVQRDFIYRVCYQTLLALGIVIPLLCGRFDYTAGAIPSLASFIVLDIVLREWRPNVWIILLLAIGMSVVLTLISYSIYILLRIPTQICTLGLVMICEAIATYIGGVKFQALGVDTTTQYYFDLHNLSYFPNNIIILAIALVLIWVLLYRTKFGKDIFSLSANTKLAINNGVNQVRNLLCCAVLCGIIFGIAGVWKVLSTDLQTQVDPESGLSSVFIAFGALGGVMVGRYLGRVSNNLVLGILCGTIAMVTITEFINVLGSRVPGTTPTIVNGSIIALFAMFQANDKYVFMFFKNISNKIKGLFTKKKVA